MSRLKEIFCEPSGYLSSKRVAGFAALVAAMVAAFWTRDLGVMEGLLFFSAACLGISGVEKFARGRNPDK